MSVAEGSILMVDGVWELRDLIASGPLQSYIRHECPNVNREPDEPQVFYWWGLDWIDEPCRGCHNHPPQDLMTVWKLHNFDFIQADE